MLEAGSRARSRSAQSDHISSLGELELHVTELSFLYETSVSLHVTPFVKKAGFGLSRGDSQCVHIFYC